MNSTKIIVRMSKSSGIYNKANTYFLKLEGEPILEMNYANNRKEFVVAPGEHCIEIGNAFSVQKEKVKLYPGQTKILTIKPSATYELGRGIMFGLVLSVIVVQFIVLQKLSLLMLLPCVGFFFLNKHDFIDSFAITKTKSY